MIDQMIRRMSARPDDPEMFESACFYDGGMVIAAHPSLDLDYSG